MTEWLFSCGCGRMLLITRRYSMVPITMCPDCTLEAQICGER